MKKKVVCIGQALVDCITRGKEPWREHVYRARSISLNTGGDALNEASLLAKMGIPVSLVCGLGEDVAGNLVYQTALERGIDVSHVSRLSKLATPIANLTVHPDGSRESCNSEATMLTGYIPDLVRCTRRIRRLAREPVPRAAGSERDCHQSDPGSKKSRRDPLCRHKGPDLPAAYAAGHFGDPSIDRLPVSKRKRSRSLHRQAGLHGNGRGTSCDGHPHRHRQSRQRRLLRLQRHRTLPYARPSGQSHRLHRSRRQLRRRLHRRASGAEEPVGVL